ncbi:hypothetical protein [Paraflavitalea speifideaquila]|uniref:hypothetical protein n=1 Tax=Paraflavitalea speifideaquila TaxID=3076558 RepID=UPI0028E52548|nr:hypothetical protein [Paraflavitalea speifideiaquila]
MDDDKGSSISEHAQKGPFVIFFLLPMLLQAQYRLHILSVDRDSAFVHQKLKLQTDFKNDRLCAEYVSNIPALLQSKGYPTASIDSVYYDTLFATIKLFVGEPLKWTRINTDSVDRKILEQVNWGGKNKCSKAVGFSATSKPATENTGLPGKQWLPLCQYQTG